MSPAGRIEWDRRHAGQAPGEPEPFVRRMMTWLPRGLALDVAAGRGRHSLLLARAGMRVVALDYSHPALAMLAAAARREHLPVFSLVADVTRFPLPEARFDTILNVNFLERAVVADLKRALKVGGALLFDTFLMEQALLGHPHDPRFLLRHGELRQLLQGLDIVYYREGLVATELCASAEGPPAQSVSLAERPHLLHEDERSHRTDQRAHSVKEQWRASALAIRRR